MSIIITNGILKKEFPKGITENERKVIIRTARKETSVPIKGGHMPSGTVLLKCYATSDNGPRRIVYILSNQSGHFILLFYRNKSDKIGTNITIKNKAFEKELIKHIDLAFKDIEKNEFIILE